MIPECKIQTVNEHEAYIEGYFLTVEQIVKLCRVFQADCYDGFVSNDKQYIETKLKEW